MSILARFSLSERVILITGASRGIGRAVAVACAETGATVAAIGRDREQLDRLHGELRRISPRPHSVLSMDVTCYDDIPGTVEAVAAQCGKIGGFVHCAGIAATIPLKMMTHEMYERIFATNVIAALEFVKSVTLKKNAAPNAAVLLISSVAACKGEPGLLAYSSSKGAVLSATRTLAAELAARKIRVNCLCPGQLTDTDMGREIMDVLPDEARERQANRYLFGPGSVSGITAPAIFLLSDAASWITGSSLLIDGGYCL